MSSLSRAAAVGAMVALLACSGDDDGGAVDAGASPTVAELIDSGCSTEVVLELSLQIAAEVSCMDADALSPFDPAGNIVFTSAAVLPFLADGARLDLEEAAGVGSGDMLVTSGFRTVAQQYLLFQWSQRGRCNIAIAATPGNSNHQSARAVDLSNYQEWIADLMPFGWDQTVAGDPVHFDHLPSPDRRGLDVQAFQRLWNRNHPDDAIDEDGVYGPQTEARLERSPAEGFAVGPSCEVGAAWRAAESWARSQPITEPTTPICAL